MKLSALRVMRREAEQRAKGLQRALIESKKMGAALLCSRQFVRLTRKLARKEMQRDT